MLAARGGAARSRKDKTPRSHGTRGQGSGHITHGERPLSSEGAPEPRGRFSDFWPGWPVTVAGLCRYCTGLAHLSQERYFPGTPELSTYGTSRSAVYRIPAPAAGYTDHHGIFWCPHEAALFRKIQPLPGFYVARAGREVGHQARESRLLGSRDGHREADRVGVLNIPDGEPGPR